MPFLSYAIVAVAAYLLGSIPTGYVVARTRGIDIRTVGSRNTGATNVLRVLGKGPGILVLIVDGLKGYAACTWLATWLIHLQNVPPADAELHRIIAGIAAVLGHNYTFWLRFKGGKGIATTAGVYFALAPVAVIVAIVAWTLTVLLTRFVSLGSLAAAVALGTAVWVTSHSLCLDIVTTALCLLAIAKHRANIQRLLKGTEHRISFKGKGTAA